MMRTLHFRLLAGMLLLVTLGLGGTDVAAYLMLKSYLYGRIDRQLTTLSTASHAFRLPDQLPQAEIQKLFLQGLSKTMASSGVRLLLLDSQGQVARILPTEDAQGIAVARAVSGRVSTAMRQRPGRPRTLNAAGLPYRAVFAQATSTSRNSGIVLAVPIRDEQQTLSRLAMTEAGASAVALLLLAGLALTVLRVGLRPLGGMAATATAIADGDSTRRIPVDHPATETGRLAEALNRAFDERGAAEDRLRRFAADASHELRTPLTTIQGWADLYFQGGLKSEQDVETAMSRIADEAGSMRGIVEDLLLLARLDQQRPLDRAPVDLTALVRDVVADARVIAPDRPITTALSDPVTVPGDAVRLRQVARNLVGNAVQHTPAGTPVRVVLGRTDSLISLTVADDGPGIPAEVQERLFERFYRDGRSRGGTGLGLAIVQAVVQAHGGAVAVHSAPGAGTAFEVTLPPQ